VKVPTSVHPSHLEPALFSELLLPLPFHLL
jgi:hypothetical protein